MVEEVIKLTVVTKNRDDVVLDKEADVEVNQEFIRELANVLTSRWLTSWMKIILISILFSRPTHRGRCKRCCCI